MHRDLKPGNIQLVPDEDGEVVKVLDFGIAKVLHDYAQGLDEDVGPTSTPEVSTTTGAMLGTPFYMSPEQLRGRRAVDERSDLWALAVIAYQCLTGKRPFQGETIGDLVLQVCTEAAPIPSRHGQVPEGFDAWFGKAVQIDPDDRYQSVGQLLEPLRELLLGESAPESRRAVATFDAPDLDDSARASDSKPDGPLSDTSMSQVRSVASDARASEAPTHALPRTRRMLVAGVVAVAAALALTVALSLSEQDPANSSATATTSPPTPERSAPPAVTAELAGSSIRPVPPASVAATSEPSAAPAPSIIGPRPRFARPASSNAETPRKPIEFGF